MNELDPYSFSTRVRSLNPNRKGKEKFGWVISSSEKPKSYHLLMKGINPRSHCRVSRSLSLFPSNSCFSRSAPETLLSRTLKMSLVANEDFQHILRVLNTNVDGKQKIMFALTSIKGTTVAGGTTGVLLSGVSTQTTGGRRGKTVGVSKKR
ncbi:hypothetical protein NC652_005674 [Populus alba x Populus x berolinensis]|nr:hypothetical protein NC652_005674 [Populus alba x Populus x berolinensis]